MKRFISGWTISVIGFILASCGSNSINKLQAENEALRTQYQHQDSLIAEVSTHLHTFEQNLEDIVQRENGILRLASNEIEDPTYWEVIFSDLAFIDSLLNHNHQLIDSLSAQIASDQGKWHRLDEALKSLNRQLVEKETTLEQLKADMTLAYKKNELLSKALHTSEQSNGTLRTKALALEDTLAVQRTKDHIQARIIREQQQELNTGYFVVGSAKTLKAHQIIETTGGVAGVGSVPMVKETFKATPFKPIDTQTPIGIPLDGKKAKVLSNHPEGSYEVAQMENGEERLTILDPVAFWQGTKYLVVLTR